MDTIEADVESPSGQKPPLQDVSPRIFPLHDVECLLCWLNVGYSNPDDITIVGYDGDLYFGIYPLCRCACGGIFTHARSAEFGHNLTCTHCEGRGGFDDLVGGMLRWTRCRCCAGLGFTSDIVYEAGVVNVL